MVDALEPVILVLAWAGLGCVLVFILASIAMLVSDFIYETQDPMVEALARWRGLDEHERQDVIADLDAARMYAVVAGRDTSSKDAAIALLRAAVDRRE